MFTEVPCDVQTCVEMYTSGHTLTEIGDALGCSYMTVRRRLADAGVEIRKVGSRGKRRHGFHCRHICLAMHEAGLTDAQIAETFGINRVTANKWIRSLGTRRRGMRGSGDRRAQERRQKAYDALAVDRTCRECGHTFHSTHANAVYCSPMCRQKSKYGNSHLSRARHYGCTYEHGVTLTRLIERDGLTCYICGKQCDPNDTSWGSSGPDRPTLDHVVPLAKGGGHVWGNVKVCCGECNSAKRDLDVAEVLATA